MLGGGESEPRCIYLAEKAPSLSQLARFPPPMGRVCGRNCQSHGHDPRVRAASSPPPAPTTSSCWSPAAECGSGCFGCGGVVTDRGSVLLSSGRSEEELARGRHSLCRKRAKRDDASIFPLSNRHCEAFFFFLNQEISRI